MEFYDKFPPNCTKFAHFFATTKNSSIDVESLYFPTFSQISAKCCKYKLRREAVMEKSRNGQGKVMEKYFVKSVGTLVVFEYCQYSFL